jgi:hypothetical protein
VSAAAENETRNDISAMNGTKSMCFHLVQFQSLIKILFGSGIDFFLASSPFRFDVELNRFIGDFLSDNIDSFEGSLERS